MSKKKGELEKKIEETLAQGKMVVITNTSKNIQPSERVVVIEG